ncbi:MAG: hypothetical protein HY298_21095 [Verrucomicrobia bacterium]|nr:hypothetical protein [Verrucomicrobiota bacterium]
MRPAIAISIGVLVLTFCQARAADLSPKEIAAAKKIYTAKCAKCHKFYDPAAYNQAEWDEWMVKMRKKSKLKSDQYALLSRYLEILRGSEKMPEK